jgi:SOS-response transcriptional repressor LexA
MTAVSLKIKNNLLLLTRMHGLTEAELCRQTNIPQATINRLLSGATDDPRISTLKAIAKFFNISIDQLLGNVPISTCSKITNSNTAKYIPIFSWNNSRDWLSLLKKIKPDNWNQWISTEPEINSACFGLEVIGDSMWPQFMEGTIIIVDPTIQPTHKDFVVCYIQKENNAVFRQYIEEGKNKTLKASNQIIPSILLSEQDKIIGIVVQSKNQHK